MARKLTPTPLKIMRGTVRKDRSNPAEPRPEPGLPEMPRHLHPRAKAEWQRLAPILDGTGVLTIADGTALSLLCDALSDYHTANEVILAQGATYETRTPTGDIMHRPRPEVAQRNDAWNRVAKMLAEFGLTPSARGKVTTAPKGASTGKARFLNA